jgi:sugar phosphate permease
LIMSLTEREGSQKSKRSINNIALFILICASYLFAIMPRYGLTINADQIMKFYGINPAGLGLLGSVYFYSYAIMQIPSGLLADMIRPEVLIIASLLAISVGNFIFSVANHYFLALAGRFLTGLAGSLIYIPGLRLLATNFPPERFGQLSGTLMAMNSVCVMLVNGPLAITSEKYGWRTVFLISGIATMVVGVVFILTSGKNSKRQGNGQPYLRSSYKKLFYSSKVAFQNKLAWPMFVRSFMNGGVSMSFQTLWAGPYMMLVLGMSRVATGKVLVLMSVGTLLASPLGGYLSDKVLKSRRKLTVTTEVLSVFCWLFLFFNVDTISPFFLNAILFLMLFVRGLGVGPATAQVKEVYPSSMAGAAMGTNNLFMTGGGAIMPVVFGLIIGKEFSNPPLQFRNMFLLSSILLCLSSVVAYISVETFGQTVHKKEGVTALPTDMKA